MENFRTGSTDNAKKSNLCGKAMAIHYTPIIIRLLRLSKSIAHS